MNASKKNLWTISRCCGAALLWLTVSGGVAAQSVPVPAVRTLPKVAVTLADLRAQYAVGKGGAFLIEVPQMLHMALDPDVSALMRGQRVESVGQWIRDETGRFRVVRSQLGCCSTHAKESGVLVELREPAAQSLLQGWVRVTAELGFERTEAGWVAVLRGASVEPAEAPGAAVLR